jgi:asparagine synthase (glutamine-hydrolysing)
MEVVVRCMAATLHHRGPDDAGTWVDPADGVALGHRRLSVLDLSPLGHQPMHSASGRYVIVFNGEIYNFRALRAELELAGHSFRGRSDTEVMLAAITEWGLQRALLHFNGMFAFAVWDRYQHSLHLARDRFGEKPLYYGWFGETFVFASELKALRVHPNFAGEIDRNALGLYMRYGYVPTPHCIYRGVRKLPPGTLLTVSGDSAGTGASPEAYWSVTEAALHSTASPFEGSDAEAAGRFEELLSDAVRIRLESDVPLGAFLSGGLDSSTIVALMQRQVAQPVRTFTVGFEEASYNEAQDAKAVAQHLGTEHTELYVTAAEAMAVIPRLPTIYDEPFADASAIPTFLISALARRHVIVSLSGDGGDELLAGYNRYALGATHWSWLRRRSRILRRALANTITLLPPKAWDRLLGAVATILPRGARQRHPGSKLHRLAGVLSGNETDDPSLLVMSHWHNPHSVVLGMKGMASVDVMLPPAMARFPEVERMMVRDALTYLPDDILVKVDRASMGVSLEARVPLLDHRVAEFCWSLPLSMKVRAGQRKWLLRQVLAKHVPPELTERPKMGFAVPIASWLRGPIRQWVEDLLDERTLRLEGFFDSEQIRIVWTKHLSGRQNLEDRLWCVLMFEAWLREQRSQPAVAR